MNNNRLPAKLLAPAYWPAWLGVALLRLLAVVPYGGMLKASRFLGNTFYSLTKRRRHVIETNIRLCFPELSPQQQQQLARQAFVSSIMAIFEGAMAWWGKREKIRQLHRIQGLEHLQQAKAKGKGVILLVSHFTNMELAAVLVHQYIPDMKIVYKRSTNALIEHFIRTKRLQRSCDDLIKHKSVRDIVRALKKGETVWYAPDQDFGTKDSIFAPFMGMQTSTLLSTQRLAKMTGAPVVPFYVARLEGKAGYEIRISPPLADFPSDDELHDATLINQAIEKQIQQNPEQYLWAHRRFKTRPPGEKDVYAG